MSANFELLSLNERKKCLEVNSKGYTEVGFQQNKNDFFRARNNALHLSIINAFIERIKFYQQNLKFSTF